MILMANVTEQYFKTTPTNEWSYLGYLEAMKSYYQRYATIISLKSTWRKSFLTALRSIERSQDREQSEAATFLLNKKSNKQEIMEYWKSVEKERRLVKKQLDVKNNTQISALNMLNVATTDQSCQVIRLLEEQSNTQAPNDCFTEMVKMIIVNALCFKLIMDHIINLMHSNNMQDLLTIRKE